MTIKTWPPPERILVVVAFIVIYASVMTYADNGGTGTFLTYLLVMLLFSGLAVLAVSIYRSLGQDTHAEPVARRWSRAQMATLAGVAACAVYAAAQAASADGGQAAAFVVVFVLSLVQLGLLVLAVRLVVTLARRRTTR